MKSDMSQSGRICLYDNVRSVLICLVVIGHCIDWHDILHDLYAFIYTFHMPAFIFLAGMFHKNERIVQKVVSYLCIYFMLKLGLFLGNILVAEVDDPFLIFSESTIPWFMFILAGYTAASYILQNIDKRFLFLAAGVFGCFAVYDQTIGTFLQASRGFLFYPFYILGEMCDRERLAAASRKPLLRLASGAILAGWAFVCFAFPDRLQPLFDWGSPFGAGFFWGPMWRILHYGISFLLCFSLICVIPDRCLPAVTVTGRRTLQIYFWHWPVVRIVGAITGIGSTLCATVPGSIVYLLLDIAMTFILSAKPFSFPTEYILYYTDVRREKPRMFKITKIGLP